MAESARKQACQALAAIFDAAAEGTWPPADGRVTILPQPSSRDAGVIAFTAHSVVFTDASPEWVIANLAPDDLAAAVSPPFLQALAARTGRVAHGTDLLACATALPGQPDIRLAAQADLSHPRISRALRYRDEVRAWEAAGGVLVIGRGLAGRWEVAVEVGPSDRSRGLGRALVTAARHLVPDGGPIWAQIAPGNAASVRAFVAAGYRPVGAESLLTAA